MTLVKYHRPERVQNSRKDLMNELFGSMMNESMPQRKQFFAMPAANIYESKVDFRIELAVPGFEKSDFSIDLDKEYLTVSLNKDEEMNDNERIHYREYKYNDFSRSFKLSDKINKEKIEAIYKNGVLQIVLPKKEEAIEKGPRTIKIS